MTLQLFRAAWFLSVLGILANLLYVYASLPEVVVVQENERMSVSREWLFYASMISILLINTLVYVFKTMFEEDENFRAWFHGLVITFNIFFIVALHTLKVYNSSELFNHNAVPFVVAGSLALIILWAAVWPLYYIVQKFLVKQTV